MKTIGLIGGMSWESSLEYYRIINETVKEKLGGCHSATCLMYSFDFYEIEQLQHHGDWDALTDRMIEAGNNLKHGGADFIVICTNTMHLMAQDIEDATGLEVLHIAKIAGKSAHTLGMKKIGLLGTKFTMEGSFYKDVIKDHYGIETIIPNDEDRNIIHNVIYNELVKGIFTEASRHAYVEIIQKLSEEGAEGVILGCTEIPLLVKQDDVSVPLFDTTTLHGRAAVEKALKE